MDIGLVGAQIDRRVAAHAPVARRAVKDDGLVQQDRVAHVAYPCRAGRPHISLVWWSRWQGTENGTAVCPICSIVGPEPPTSAGSSLTDTSSYGPSCSGKPIAQHAFDNAKLPRFPTGRPLGEAFFVRKDSVVEGHEDGADQGHRRREQEPLVGMDEGGVHGPHHASDDSKAHPRTA